MRPLFCRRLSRRRAFLALLGALPAACAGQGWAWGQAEAPERKESNERLEVMRRLARATRLSEVEDGKPGRLASLRPEPLVRYNDPVRGIQDAILWGWGDRGRLTAILKVEYWTNPPARRWGIGVASLATVPLEIEFSNGFVQTLRKAGWEPQTSTAEPPPAGSAVQRLIQMKTLARRFSVTVHSGRNQLQLRLLPTPVDRYDDPGSGILDGAVFAFSSGTNPTALLAVEAGQTAGAASSWRFGFARHGISKMFARLDDKEVWTQPYAGVPGSSDIYTNITILEDAAAR